MEVVAAQVANTEPQPIEWLNIYGAPYVKRMGAERILRAPAWQTGFLANGCLFVALGPHPDDVSEQDAARVAKHLGVPGPLPRPHTM